MRKLFLVRDGIPKHIAYNAEYLQIMVLYVTSTRPIFYALFCVLMRAAHIVFWRAAETNVIYFVCLEYPRTEVEWHVQILLVHEALSY